MAIKEKILKIMSLALEINPPEIDDIGKKKTAVFVSWLPHCNLLDITICESGWNENCEAEFIKAFTDKDDSDKQLDALIERLEEIMEDLFG